MSRARTVTRYVLGAALALNPWVLGAQDVTNVVDAPFQPTERWLTELAPRLSGVQVEGPVGHPTYVALPCPPAVGTRPPLIEAVVLAGASLGGLWAGAQVPFDPADDDSDFSVWHLATAPAASVGAVTLASVLMGNSTPRSLRASLLGAAAGIVAGAISSTLLETEISGLLYAGVHGTVTAIRN